ncbi:hypothetical protein [Pseudarthrobacter sp. C4D7]|uniref:hypothetical protein n=1 Tax=Pseudarthrobacter sp. C4D7 TaxID=2735268 RepID=UPI001584C1BD|nr:hypothetical protein [Pseudarthrobacter sp. C4D7]NUT71225.1 hypothetical protein [Pseudarthrobacter sp. C4D7]
MNRIQLPDYVAAKVGRAEHHLQDLDELLSKQAQPISSTAESVFQPFDDGIGAWGAKLRITGRVPDEVPLIVGDFLHNLRASLDYLAQALVRTSGNEPIDGVGGTSFPILDKPKPHGQLTVKGGVDPAIGLAIEALQPYQTDPNLMHWNPLLLLHKLSNRDKHRQLHFPLAVAVEPVSMMVGLLPDKPVGLIQSTMRSFSDGEWLFHPVAQFPSDVRVEVVVAAKPPMITLEGASCHPGGGTVDLVDSLDYMLRHVRGEVVPCFREYFLEPWPEDTFTADPVPGPLGIPERSPDEHSALVDAMISVMASEYGSDRYLVLGLADGFSA